MESIPTPTRSRAISNRSNYEFCRKLADLLMIEADGGDDPAAVVAWAINKAALDMRADDLEAQAADTRAKAEII